MSAREPQSKVRGEGEGEGRRTHQVFLLKSFVSVLMHLSDMFLKLIQSDGSHPCSFCEGARGSKRELEGVRGSKRE